MVGAPPKWASWHIATAALIYAREAAKDSPRPAIFAEIASVVKFSFNAVKSRFYLLGPTFALDEAPAKPGHRRRARKKIDCDEGRPTEGALRLSPAQIADRDARAEAARQRSFSQEFFNEPPPGFSAYDKARSLR